MKLNDVVRAATEVPARALRREKLGSLRPGSVGEASVVALEQGTFDYVDSTGEHLKGDQRLTAAGVVLNGRWWNGQGDLSTNY